MHLHIVAIDRQLTVHTKEDAPLSKALDVAFKFHGKKRTKDLVVTTGDGRELDPAATPETNELESDAVVYVGPRPEPEPVSEEPDYTGYGFDITGFDESVVKGGKVEKAKPPKAKKAKAPRVPPPPLAPPPPDGSMEARLAESLATGQHGKKPAKTKKRRKR